MTDTDSTGRTERTRPWTPDETLRALLRTMRRPGNALVWPAAINHLNAAQWFSGLTANEPRAFLSLFVATETLRALLAWADALGGPVTINVTGGQDGAAHVHVRGCLDAGPWIDVVDIVEEPPAELVAGEMALDAFRELVHQAATDREPVAV